MISDLPPILPLIIQSLAVFVGIGLLGSLAAVIGSGLLGYFLSARGPTP